MKESVGKSEIYTWFLRKVSTKENPLSVVNWGGVGSI